MSEARATCGGTVEDRQRPQMPLSARGSKVVIVVTLVVRSLRTM